MLTFLNVFRTIYKSFPMSCKGILWNQNLYCSNFEFSSSRSIITRMSWQRNWAPTQTGCPIWMHQQPTMHCPDLKTECSMKELFSKTNFHWRGKTLNFFNVCPTSPSLPNYVWLIEQMSAPWQPNEDKGDIGKHIKWISIPIGLLIWHFVPVPLQTAELFRLRDILPLLIFIIAAWKSDWPRVFCELGILHFDA